MASRDPIPPLDLILAFAPAALLLLLALGGWVLPPAPARQAVLGGWLVGTGTLLFLAGVTRGLSFFTPGGPRAVQVGVMGWLFALGFGALLLPLRIAFVLLILGYATVAAFDPPAARAGLAPAYFARLRPGQAAIMGLALAMLLARVLFPG